MSSTLRPTMRIMRQQQALSTQYQQRQTRWICSSCSTQNTSVMRLRPRTRSATPSTAPFRPRYSSTEPRPPPMMSKLKADLKAAMLAKDKPRLNVLRALISDINNSTKTASPVTTDLQILAMLKKRRAGSEAAQTEAMEQKRPDIAEKQQGEIDVINEYAGSVQVLSEQEIKDLIMKPVQEIMEKIESPARRVGEASKAVFAQGGVLFEKAVDRATVMKVIQELLGSK